MKLEPADILYGITLAILAIWIYLLFADVKV